jgi:hypothetical protein
MLWIGKIGALVQVPSPRRGMDTTWDRASTVAGTIGGGQVVSFAPGGRRTIKAQWGALSYSQYQVLEELYVGARGPGPWVVLDSARRNHLTRNQASATSADGDAGGFTVDPLTEQVTSTPDVYLRGPRSARWTLPATVVTGVLELDPPAGLIGVPAPAGQPWTFSGSVTCTGIAPSVTLTPALSWRRVDGSEVSATLGTPVAAAAGGWTAYNVSAAAPPAGAVAVRAQLRVTPGAVTTAALLPGNIETPGTPAPARVPATGFTTALPGRTVMPSPLRRRPPPTVQLERAPITTTDVLVDQLQLDMSAAARAWAPGTGVPQCSWLSLSDVETWVDHRMPVAAVLVEVG